jgi:hypothetical protein
MFQINQAIKTKSAAQQQDYISGKGAQVVPLIEFAWQRA